MFSMRLGEFAGYTMNYHHAGGPRCYTVVKPIHHGRLEEMLCLTLNRKRPTPPTCTQFVSHEKVYIPKDALRQNQIAFTEVTQFEGEMVVFFPYAYYQGFNAGPNITEELTYANERWKTFHRKGLYVLCNKDCDEGEETFNLDFARQPLTHDDGNSDDEDEDVLPSNAKRKIDSLMGDSEDDDDVQSPVKRRR